MNRRRNIFKIGRGLVLLMALVLGLSLGLSTNPVLADGCDINVPTGETTIQAAINVATPGQTICVAAGTYSESPVTVNKAVTINGANAGKAGSALDRIVPESRISDTKLTITAAGVVIDGVEIYQTNDTADAILIQAAATVQNSVVKRFGVSTGTVARGITTAVGTAGFSVTGNLFTGDPTGGFFGGHKTWNSGLYINGGSGSVTGNVFENNRTAINADDFNAGITISGNTFRTSGTYLAFGGTSPTDGQFTISDNEFFIDWVDPVTNWLPSTLFNNSNVAATFRINAINNTFGGVATANLTEAQKYAIEARMFHRGRSNRNGVVDYILNEQIVVPGTTIQSAINAAAAGDTIRIAAGTYSEALTIGKSITLLGSNSAISPNMGTRVAETILQPAIAASARPALLANANDITVAIRGITIDMANTAAGYRFVDAINRTNNSWEFTNNRFINAFGSVNGNWYVSGNSTGFELKLYDNYFANNQSSNGIALFSGNVHMIDIRDNVWLDNATWAFNFNNVHGSIENNRFIDTRTNPSLQWYEYQSGFILSSSNNAVTLSGNQFEGLYLGINLYEGFAGPLTAIGNTFENSRFAAIRARSTDPVTGNLNGVNFAFNSFTGNATGIDNPRSQVFRALNNWWGSASGPSGAGAGTGDAVSANVNFTPWLGAPLDEINSAMLAPTEILSGPDGSSAENNGPGSFLVVLSKFIGNPSNVPNFAGASAFYDIFVSGAGTGDSLDVTLPATPGAGFLYFYDGSEWKEVLNGGLPISPSGNFYDFVLDNTSTPKLTELDGTPFTGAGNEEIRITPTATIVAAGETFQVVVDAGSDGLFGVDVNMVFDTDVFSVTNIALGNGLAAGTIAVNTYDNGAGTLNFAYSQLGSNIDNVSGTNLVLATITFLAHTDGDGEIALGTSLFTDKDGNPATPLPLDSPIALTIDPSPEVTLNVALQGRASAAGGGISLEMKPDVGNVLYDPDDTDAVLGIDPVPANTYRVRVSAPKYLAAERDITILNTDDIVDLNDGNPLTLRGGDINGDDQINIQDLVLIGVNFGSTTVLTADINGDNVVNIQDLAIAAGNFGLKTVPASGNTYPVPWQ